MDELIEKKYIPSFCTACYRMGQDRRAFHGIFRSRFYQAVLPAQCFDDNGRIPGRLRPGRYQAKGYALVAEKLAEMEDDGSKAKLVEKIGQIREGKRDLYF